MTKTLPLWIIVAAMLGLAAPASAVLPTPTATPGFRPGPGDAFQIRYASNLNVGDSVINITNAGTQGGAETNSICTNVYVFDQFEELISCCSCKVTPNGLVSLSAVRDLISNTLTPQVPNSIVVKLLATNGTGTTCNAGSASPPFASGMRAWGTTLHALPTSPVTYGVTETEFSRATLSASEWQRITSQCNFIQTDGSGFGICASCRAGGL